MPDPPARTGPAKATLQQWLTDRVAYYVGRDPEDIDAGTPLTAYGLDSVYSFALCGDIEDELHLAVAPTLVWDHTTVAALAAYLAGALAAQAPPLRRTP
ncbi:MAG: hypothetical protein V7603_3994 [Micromonosporaceae bacterium]